MSAKADFDNVVFVLVEPKNPGNIGAAARAMKNMGFSRMRLVNPVIYRDVPEQRKLGYRSQDIIRRSREYPTLKEALADTGLVILTTKRRGKWKRDFLSIEEICALIVERMQKEKIAVVFGREDSGVTIDESQSANVCVELPSAIDYPSLNLAQAVMLFAYECYKYRKQEAGANRVSAPGMAKKQAFNRLSDNIWSLMQYLKIREEKNGLFHRSLKRALNRTRWTNADIAVFDRVCKQVRWYTGRYTDADRPSSEENDR